MMPLIQKPEPVFYTDQTALVEKPRNKYYAHRRSQIKRDNKNAEKINKNPYIIYVVLKGVQQIWWVIDALQTTEWHGT